MTLTSCLLCHREALRPRWVGDLLMTFCDLCGCLHVPEAPIEEPEPVRSVRAESVRGNDPAPSSEPLAV